MENSLKNNTDTFQLWLCPDQLKKKNIHSFPKRQIGRETEGLVS